MKKRKIRKHLALMLLVAMVLNILTPLDAFAAKNLPFGSPIYSKQMQGEIKITGNTLQRPVDSTPNINQILNGEMQINNNKFITTHLDLDDDDNTANSSSANLIIKADATVEKAYLIWGATVTGKPNAEFDKTVGPTIKFKTPKTADYQTITPTKWNQFPDVKKDYTAYADVTDLVKQGGAGTYWGADIPQGTNTNDRYGGWALVVVFKDSTQPLNDLSVYFGHAQIKAGSPEEITVTDLNTPPTGEVKTKVGFVVWEGDIKKGSSGNNPDDYVIVKKNELIENKLKDAYSHENNFFRSIISDNGELLTNRNPANLNNVGIDAKIVNADGYLDNEATEAKFTFGSSWEWYYPTILTTQIELYSPEIEITKTVINETGNDPAKVGDILEYTIVAENTSVDPATNTIAIDPLPKGVDYELDTIEVKTGSEFIKMTDGAGDDIAEYDAEKNQVVIRIGEGANATQGGTFKKGDVFEAKFKVKINEEALGAPIKNTLDINFNGSFAQGMSEAGTVSITPEPQKPDFTFEKTADKDKDYEPKVGDEITYNFTVTNTGNVTLKEISLEDNMSFINGETPVLNMTELAPTEIATASAKYKVTQADMDKGFVKNTAKVQATPPDGKVIEKSDFVRLPAEQTPSFTFEKTADKDKNYKPKVGDEIKYTFTVKNTGNVTLKEISITDNMFKG
ncbi:MAG: isopeptide-forming domain-containing fimbrial protein, partial [Tissierellia bacterium]|nr:isopeptide-forming domain-containing fimbrial protein [Tissierellia bacterium]